MRCPKTMSTMSNRPKNYNSPPPLIQSLIRRPLGVLGAVVFALTIGASSAFNVDTRYPIVHTRAPGSQFGYSLAFYHSPSAQRDMLIVGAPRENSEAPRRDVRQSGAVYECQVDGKHCRELLLDRTGNEHRLNGSRPLTISEKSFQLMGATVAASKDGSTILACAPHYKYFFSKFEVIEPVGTCWYGSGTFANIREFSPCRQEPERHGYHRFGYGMCGFSAAIPDRGERLFVSAPGNYYWQGSVFSQNVTRLVDRPNTPEGPKENDHQMMGYSTTVGDFDGDEADDVVVGVPRGDELRGMVSIYTQRLRWIANLTDQNGQAGQYFGHSVAVVDLNNDGFDDVIVGAPFYTDYKNVKDGKTQERKPQYEVGKISVFLQRHQRGTFQDPIHIVGKVQWARFGFSIASAGDLNHDGYGDFVVGAPLENGHGAVYVFHGPADGLRVEPTQKITPKDLQGVRADIKTFGFSLTGGRDVDGNKFDDIAVGAQDSATAFVLRTKPVLTITGSAKTLKKAINLDDRNCETEKGPMSCEGLKYCIQFEGELDRRNEQIELTVQVRLDAKAPSPRAFFTFDDLRVKPGISIHEKSQSRDYPDIVEQRIYLRRGEGRCEDFQMYIPDSIRDKINPIHVAVNYTYAAREPSTFPGYFEPAVDTTVPQEFTTDLIIDKNCGPDGECIPDLQLHAIPNKPKFAIGTDDQTVVLNVSLANRGEDSFQTQLTVAIPDGFEYSGVENHNPKRQISCSSHESEEDYKFICDVGNPLPAGEVVTFGMKLTGTNVDPSAENVKVIMSAASQNPELEETLSNNVVVVVIPIEIKAQVSLVGRSNPEQLDYSIRNRSYGIEATFDFEVGPLVTHLYQVINRGPSTVSSATLDIFWPSFAENGKHLLYLIDVPLVSSHGSTVKCRVKQSANVNPESLTISNQHLPTDENYLRRVRRNADDDSKVKENMRDAVRLAKQAGSGSAVAYSGGLSRISVNCNSLNCTHIECDIGEMRKDDFVLVEVFSRLWVNTLIDDNIFEADISSLALAKISALRNAPHYQPTPQLIAVTTDVNPTDPELYQRDVPWWLYLLAILIGLVILALLILCLWRCGFFKRNRPHTEKAKLERSLGEGEHYADSRSRYAHGHTYSRGEHGDRL